MATGERIYLEAGRRWVFACAIDWPGWARRGRGEEAAIEALLAYAPRYGAAVDPSFVPRGVQVVGRLEGDATTDFGAPSAVGPWDAEPMDGGEADRQLALVDAAWRAFDAVVAGSAPVLRKGPRGGGRDRDQIADHVRDAERAYASRVGARIPPRTPWPAQRSALSGALRAVADGSAPAGRWPARYSIRRVVWHVLDHAWEIEDRRG